MGVRWETMLAVEHGTVSEQCAREMADGGKQKLGADFVISVTGIAGSEKFIENGIEKENGLIFIGISGPRQTSVHRYQLKGDRSTIRSRVVALALSLLRNEILSV